VIRHRLIETSHQMPLEIFDALGFAVLLDVSPARVDRPVGDRGQSSQILNN